MGPPYQHTSLRILNLIHLPEPFSSPRHTVFHHRTPDPSGSKSHQSLRIPCKFYCKIETTASTLFLDNPKPQSLSSNLPSHQTPPSITGYVTSTCESHQSCDINFANSSLRWFQPWLLLCVTCKCDSTMLLHISFYEIVDDGGSLGSAAMDQKWLKLLSWSGFWRNLKTVWRSMSRLGIGVRRLSY